MGTYYNPGLQKSYSSNFRKDKPVDAGLLSLLKSRQQAIAKDKLRSANNWKIRQQTLEKIDVDQQTLIDAGRAKGVDVESLISSTSKVMKEYANRKIRLAQATSKYPGYEKDEAFVRNTKSMIVNAASTFGVMKNAVNNYREAMDVGFGDGPGEVAPESINPGFMAMNEMAKPNSNIKGTISWQMDYDEAGGWLWSQVAKGEAIGAANKSMGIKGDTYVLPYQGMLDINENNDKSAYNHAGMYNTNPVIVNNEDKNFLQEQKIYNKDNAIEAKYYIKGQATKGNTVFDTKEVNLKRLYNDLNTVSTSIFYRIAQGTDNVVAAGPRAYLGNGVEKEVIDGLTQYVYYKPSFKENGGLKIDSEGNPYKDPSNKVILGDDKLGGGQFIRVPNEENRGRYGFNEEQFKEYTDWVHYQTAWNSGAFINPQDEVNESATKLLRQRPKPTRLTENQIRDNEVGGLIRSTIESFRKDVADPNISNEVAVDKLKGMDRNGIYVISSPDDLGLVSIYQSMAGKDDKLIESDIDINTDLGMNRVLLAYKITPTKNEIEAGVSQRTTSNLAQVKEEKDAYNVKLDSYTTQLKDKDKEYDRKQHALDLIEKRIEPESTMPLPDDEDEFQESFSKKDLNALDIKELKIPNNFNNEIDVIGIDGKSLGTFDPSTEKGKAEWKAIVEKQLSKGEEPVKKPEVPPAPGPKPGNAGQFNPPK
jgi:hypothetical protein